MRDRLNVIIVLKDIVPSDALYCIQEFILVKSLSHRLTHTKLVHTDEKNLCCDICQTAFKTPDALKVYKSGTHVEERFFPAKIALKTSKQMGPFRATKPPIKARINEHLVYFVQNIFIKV